MLTYREHDRGTYGGLRALRLADGGPHKPIQVITEERRSSDVVAVPEGDLVLFSGGPGVRRNDISTTFVPSAANAAPSTSKLAAWLRKLRVKGGPRHKDVQ